jgi:hypothetical protein
MLQIDDGNMQTSIDSSRSRGEISILDEEWDMLLKRVSSDLATGGHRAGASGHPTAALPLRLLRRPACQAWHLSSEPCRNCVRWPKAS